MSITNTAKLLGVSRPVIYRLIADGKLTAIRNPLYKAPGGPVRIPRSEIEALAREKGIELR